MTQTQIPMPNVVSQAEWLDERKKLLAEEKESTKLKDKINANRRRLPMVKLEKEYTFDTADGKKSLKDLFASKHQLIVYHFMFDPEWEEGCPGCTGFIDALGDLTDLANRDTCFVVVSRAPLEKLQIYKQEHGWDIN
ncbi:MAG: DUF899 family protein, partial [Chlorobia bacterium]|nr:DUF899 family protein [Fimbriimonadaceae bacterium]